MRNEKCSSPSIRGNIIHILQEFNVGFGYSAGMMTNRIIINSTAIFRCCVVCKVSHAISVNLCSIISDFGISPYTRSKTSLVGQRPINTGFPSIGKWHKYNTSSNVIPRVWLFITKVSVLDWKHLASLETRRLKREPCEKKNKFKETPAVLELLYKKTYLKRPLFNCSNTYIFSSFH